MQRARLVPLLRPVTRRERPETARPEAIAALMR